MTLVDTEARTRIATDLATNLFVEAGAGTGKTQSLVNRILGLVTTGTFPNGIADLAAITFTENAAAELRNRVRQQLDRAVADPALAADERERCRAALASLDDASLSTLHGFALRLLSDFPLEADLPLGFTVQDDIRAGLARDLWWARSVDAALGDPALAEVWTTCLALELTPRALRVIADRMQADWDQLESMVITPPAVPQWDMAAVVGPLQEAVKRYADVGPEGDTLTAYLRGPLRTLLDDLDAEPDDLGRASVLLNQAIKTRCGDRAAWMKTGTPKSGPVNLLVQADSAWQAQLSASRTACIEQLACWLRDVVLDDAARRQTEGSLHFHDLLVLARRLLQKPQVREALHHRWPVIMVDEFQDTDPLQVEIVHLLASATFPDSWQECDAAGGRLFFVGDPKQSIYRFRRADVELYNAVRETIAVRPQLVQNFRSRPGILRVVNHSLRELMDGKPGQVPYAELTAAREEVPGEKGPDVLLLGKGHATDMAGVRQEEAAHVARICRQAAGHWTVRDGRLAAYRDMALLVPTRTSLSQLERALQAEDVPYRIESRSLVWDTDIVRELLVILEAVDDPTDAVAVVAALRSAAFGCNDDDLLAWRTAGGSWDYRLSAVEQPAVTAAMGALKSYHDRRWWMPVNELIDDLIRERRMVELTIGLRRPRDHWRRLRFVADQARAFLDSGGSSLGGFVRWAREQAERGADAVETVVEEPDDDAVRILTIHSAKGLEFPVVVLTGLNVNEDLRVNTLWDGGRVEVCVKGFQTSGWDAARARERALFEAEAVRLLYVAATRAEDHLVVSLHHKTARSAGRNHAARVHAQLGELTGLGAVHEAEPLEAAPVAEVPVVGLAPDVDAREAAFAARDALLARVERSVPVSASALAREDDEEPVDELAMAVGVPEQGDQPTLERRPVTGGATLGSAVHRVLELVDFDATDELVRDVATAVTAELEAPQLLSETARRVRIALSSDLLRSASNGRMWKEVPISAPVGERFVEGYIDLVLEREEGLLIVDYKTDGATTEAELNAKASHYGPQLRAYAYALAIATGRPVVGAALLFIGTKGCTRRDVELRSFKVAVT